MSLQINASPVEQKWEEIKNHLISEFELSQASYNTWIEPLQIYKSDYSSVTILVPLGEMGRDYIMKKYFFYIKASIAEVTGIDYEVILSVPSEIEQSEKSESISDEAVRLGLNPKYRFDTFVVGNNNQFAHAACMAVAETPGKIYNPLFLYSGVGLGKTHLINSIAYYILEHSPELKIMYVTSEAFTNEVVAAIRNGDSSALSRVRDKYRSIDVLLIDDIQFVIGKESTQEEFFHTFNTLHNAGKQIILTSDRPPKEMKILDERFRSRFVSGLMVDIQNPDFETRMAILQKKQELEGFHVSDDVLQYIAENVSSNIRELEGSLNKIIAFARLEKQDITLELAEKVLSDIIYRNEKKVITPEYVLDIICDHFNTTPENIRSKKKSRDVAFPRQIAEYLIYTLTHSTQKKTADFLNIDDHTTVGYAVRKMEKDYNSNIQTRETIDLLRKKINPPA